MFNTIKAIFGIIEKVLTSFVFGFLLAVGLVYLYFSCIVF